MTAGSMGALVLTYHLGAHDEAGVQPAHTLTLTNATAEWDPRTQQFRAAYAVGLPGGPAAALLPYPVIYAGASCLRILQRSASACFRLCVEVRLRALDQSCCGHAYPACCLAWLLAIGVTSSRPSYA